MKNGVYAIAIYLSSCSVIVLSWTEGTSLFGPQTVFSQEYNCLYRVIQLAHNQLDTYAITCRVVGSDEWIRLSKLEIGTIDLDNNKFDVKITELSKIFSFVPRYMTINSYFAARLTSPLQSGELCYKQIELCFHDADPDDKYPLKRYRQAPPQETKEHNADPFVKAYMNQRHFTCVTSSDENLALVAADSIGMIRVWFIDRESMHNYFIGPPAHSIHWHHVAVTALALSSNGSTIYSAGGECSVVETILHSRGKHTQRFLHRIEGTCAKLACSTSHNILLATLHDRSIRVIDVAAMRLRTTIHCGVIASLNRRGQSFAPRLAPLSLFESTAEDENIIIMEGRPGYIQCVRMQNADSGPYFRQTAMIDLLNINYPLIERESGLQPYQAIKHFDYHCADSKFCAWIAYTNTYVNDIDSQPISDLINDYTLSIYCIDQYDRNVCKEKQIYPMHSYLKDYYKIITAIKFLKFQSTDDEECLQLLVCTDGAARVFTCVRNYQVVKHQVPELLNDKMENHSFDTSRKPVYEWKATQTIIYKNQTPLDCALLNNRLIIAFNDTLVLYFMPKDISIERRIIDSTTTWQRQDSLPITNFIDADVVCKMTTDAQSNTILLLSTDGSLSAYQIIGDCLVQKYRITDGVNLLATRQSSGVGYASTAKHVFAFEIKSGELQTKIEVIPEDDEDTIHSIVASTYSACPLLVLTQRQCVLALCETEKPENRIDKIEAMEVTSAPFAQIHQDYIDAQKKRKQNKIMHDVESKVPVFNGLDTRPERAKLDELVKKFYLAPTGSMPMIEKVTDSMIKEFLKLDK